MSNDKPIKKLLKGTLILNSHQMNNLTDFELRPAGNGHYMITLRQFLTNELAEDFEVTYKGKTNFVYRHPALHDQRFEGRFVDHAIEDGKGETILSLFFDVQKVAPVPMIELPKNNIQLVK